MNNELVEKAIEVSKNAYSPYSKAKVGCAALSNDEQVFLGANIENSSFGATICAERTAIASGIANGAKWFKEFYLYTKDGWPPCGVCRQVMSEFCQPDTQIHLINETKNIKSYRLSEIYPLAFTPKHIDNLNK